MRPSRRPQANIYLQVHEPPRGSAIEPETRPLDDSHAMSETPWRDGGEAHDQMPRQPPTRPGRTFVQLPASPSDWVRSIGRADGVLPPLLQASFPPLPTRPASGDGVARRLAQTGSSASQPHLNWPTERRAFRSMPYRRTQTLDVHDLTRSPPPFRQDDDPATRDASHRDTAAEADDDRSSTFSVALTEIVVPQTQPPQPSQDDVDHRQP